MPPTHSRRGEVEPVLRRRLGLPGRRVTRRPGLSWRDDTGSHAEGSAAVGATSYDHEISTVAIEISWLSRGCFHLFLCGGDVQSPLDLHEIARHGRVLTVRCHHGSDLGSGHCLRFCRLICGESLDDLRERPEYLVVLPSAAAQLFAVETEIVFRRANGSSCTDPVRTRGDSDFTEHGIRLPAVELFRVSSTWLVPSRRSRRSQAVLPDLASDGPLGQP